jgi:hypothetical protein
MNADILKNWKFLTLVGLALIVYAVWIASERK